MPRVSPYIRTYRACWGAKLTTSVPPSPVLVDQADRQVAPSVETSTRYDRA